MWLLCHWTGNDIEYDSPFENYPRNLLRFLLNQSAVETGERAFLDEILCRETTKWRGNAQRAANAERMIREHPQDAVLTLKHGNQLYLGTAHPNSAGVTVENETIQIRRKGETEWLTLGTPSSLSPWTARIAGTFKLRAAGTVNGRPVESGIVEVEVRFPCYDEIVGDTNVLSMVDAAWQDTLAACTDVPNLRNEIGFWICLNTDSDEYEARERCSGSPTGPFGTGSVPLPPRPADIPANPSLVSSGCVYPVASFHTHTPTTYRTGIGLLPRGVGPSTTDNLIDTQDKVPGVVYDYVESPVATPYQEIILDT